jgi:hypothetical protein
MGVVFARCLNPIDLLLVSNRRLRKTILLGLMYAKLNMDFLKFNNYKSICLLCGLNTYMFAFDLRKQGDG